MKADLETRIADALGATLSSGELTTLVGEVKAADERARATSATASDRALDPKTKPADVATARKDAEDAEFYRRRMERAMAALTDLHKAALNRERLEAQRKEHEAGIAERDALVADLAEYDELANKIVCLLNRLQASNARVGEFNSAEIIARQAGERWVNVVDATLPKLLQTVKLPKFKRDGTIRGYLWPQQ